MAVCTAAGRLVRRLQTLTPEAATNRWLALPCRPQLTPAAAFLADMALVAAISAKDFEGMVGLIGDSANLMMSDDALTPEHHPLGTDGLTTNLLLKLWEKFQADKVPPTDEEAEAKDVTSEEYAAELAAELTGAGVAEADAGYTVKALLGIGFYFGGRGDVPLNDTGDKTFDLAQGPKSSLGFSLLPGGDVYAGEFADGKREGTGALKTAAGTVYAGEWIKGKRHGQGTMTYADGGKYAGSWKYGKRHGVGTFTYASGDSYSGAWHAGEKHGKGTYTATAAAGVYEGTWQFGTMVASKLTMKSADSAAFYGAFDKDGRPAGAGGFAFGNGVTLTGSYVAPPVEEVEGDEPRNVTPSVWHGGACGAVEATSDAAMTKELTSVAPIKNILLCGDAEAGKAAIVEQLTSTLGLHYLHADEAIKAAGEDGENELGQQAKAILEAEVEEGAPPPTLPDELQLAIVAQALSDVALKEKGWLLDGFPKTAAQAAALETVFLIPTKAIVLNVNEAELVPRVAGRRTDPSTDPPTEYHATTNPPMKAAEPPPLEEGAEPPEEPPEPTMVIDEEKLAALEQRPEDTEEAIKARLEILAAAKEGLVGTFPKLTAAVDATKPVEEVVAEIMALLA